MILSTNEVKVQYVIKINFFLLLYTFHRQCTKNITSNKKISTKSLTVLHITLPALKLTDERKMI